MRPTISRPMFVMAAVLFGTVIGVSAASATPATVQEAIGDLRNCLRVELGISRSDAERIMGVPLQPSGERLEFAHSKCLISITSKDRVHYVISVFNISTDLSFEEIYQSTLKALPFSIESFGKIELNRF